MFTMSLMRIKGISMINIKSRWRDENGCYYNKDGEPAGWFVLHPGDVYLEHFYDADGYFVPSDAEDSQSDHEVVEEVED